MNHSISKPCQRLNVGLTDTTAHVWLTRLALVGKCWPEWEESLAPAERSQAGRFLRPADQLRSGASRALLRLRLGHYLGVPPGQLRFGTNRFGKPILEQVPPAGRRIGFNVSHSGDFAVLGFALNGLIGVDLEMHRNQAIEEVEGEICSPAELGRLESLRPDERTDTLYRYWTLKEAYLKAIGVGLSHGPKRVEVAPGGGVRSAGGSYTIRVRGNWTASEIETPSGYSAAVVVSGQRSIVVCRELG